jgi:hypothetical protein
MAHTISDLGRNWFGTSTNSDHAKEFEKLTQLGLATKCKAPSWAADEVVFQLTKEGREILKVKNEKQ